MATVYRRENLGLRTIPGHVVIIPPDLRAKLMFYLDCISTVLDMSETVENLGRLRDFSNYYLLTDVEVDKLIIACLHLNPELFDGVCIFHKPEMCGILPNKFYELESVRDQMVITNEVLVGERRTRIMKVMFYTDTWLLDFCVKPFIVLGKIYVIRCNLVKSTLNQLSRGIPVNRTDFILPSYSTVARIGSKSNNVTNTSECCTIL